MARVPLASGLLTGKYRPGDVFDNPDDIRSQRSPAEIQEALRQAEEIARDEVPPGVPMAAWALAWCLKHPAVACVIPGCKSAEQVTANAAGADVARRRPSTGVAGPVIILANSVGGVGMAAAIAALQSGLPALDVVEAGIRPVEIDPAVDSVGVGGWPNLLGEVELDASLMDGRTLATGAVAALRGYIHPISVARQVMTRLPHVFLVGDGAARFAAEIGAEAGETLTQMRGQNWDAWLARHVPADIRSRWPDVPLAEWARLTADPETAGGTTTFLVKDAAGDIAAGVSTCGWACQVPRPAGRLAGDRRGQLCRQPLWRGRVHRLRRTHHPRRHGPLGRVVPQNGDDGAVDTDPGDGSKDALNHTIMELATSLANWSKANSTSSTLGQCTASNSCVVVAARAKTRWRVGCRRPATDTRGPGSTSWGIRSDEPGASHSSGEGRGGCGDSQAGARGAGRVDCHGHGLPDRNRGVLYWQHRGKILQEVDCSVLTVKPEGFVSPVTVQAHH